jgi:hypothetical protein
MNIAAIAANPVARGPVQTEFIKDIRAVGKALASDDLEAAQDKFKEFRQEVLRLHPGGIETTKLSREIKDDLWALQSALKVSDLQAAQHAFEALATDVRQNSAPKPFAQPEATSGLNVMG